VYDGSGITRIPLPTGQIVTVVQTGANVIVQSDPLTEPFRLSRIDDIPNASNAVVQLLQGMEQDWSRDRVVNDVQIANQGGGAFRVVDDASQKEYGPRTYQRLDFLNNDAKPEYTTERINDFINGWTEAMLRINSVTFTPNEETYKWVLAMWLTDLVRVRYTHPVYGWGFAIVTHIQGFAHSLTTNGWTVSLNLDQPASYVFWDKPLNDVTGWDADYWDDGIWDNADANAAYWSSGQVWSDSDSKWSE